MKIKERSTKTVTTPRGKTFTFLSLIIILIIGAVTSPLHAMEAQVASQTTQDPQATIQTRLKEALEWEDWESTAYDLIDALEEHSDAIPTPETQEVAFSVLRQIFNNRISYFQETLGQVTDIEALQLLLTTANNNKFFASQHKQQIHQFQRVATIEQAIFDSKETDSYANKLTKLSAIERSGQGQAFENSTKTLFFEQVTTAFNQRGEKQKTDLDKLKNLLERGTVTTLLTSQQQDVIRGYLALFNLEDQIMTALQNPDYNQKLAAINTALQATTNKQLDATSSSIISNALQTLVAQKPLDPAALANLTQVLQQANNNPGLPLSLKGNIQNNLLPQLTGQPAPALQQAQGQPIPGIMSGNTPMQTAQAPTMGTAQPGLLLFQQELEKAMANPTTLQKVDAVTLVMNKYFTVNVFPEAKNAFALALQTLFDQRYAPIKTQTVREITEPKKKVKKKAKKKKKKKKKAKKRKKAKKKKKSKK